MDDATDTTQPGTDRRSALKKAAIAAGVVAWTTPAVQAVTGRAAHAQTVTGCAPVLKATAQKTGSTCQCVDAPSKACCSDNTVFITVTATCGALCPGNTKVDVTFVSGKAKPGCPDEVAFRDLICPGGTDTVTIGANVTCPDGKTYTVKQDVTVVCLGCDKAAAAIIEPGSSGLAEEPLAPVEAEVTAETPPPETAPPETAPPETAPPETPPPQQETPPAGGTLPAEGSDTAEQQGSATIP